MCSNSDWRSGIASGRLDHRVAQFQSYHNMVTANSSLLYERVICGPMDRTVWVKALFESEPKEMIMMGSNNYLGFANHPRIKKAIAAAMNEFGTGVAGPALLNGTTRLHKELEATLAALKGHDDVCLFSSGYQANLAILQALITKDDLVIYDESSHASFIRGLRPLMEKTNCRRPLRFRHNNMSHLRQRLQNAGEVPKGDVFVAVESVYSMEGDVTDLLAVDELRREFGFQLILDDAHGLGVMGEGRGSEHQFGVHAEISMGTFSKSMTMTGGYVAGSHALVNYLRYFAESGVFSASLPITTVAAVLEGLKLIEAEPERVHRLHENARYLSSRLREVGYSVVSSESSILSIPIPKEVDIRQFNLQCHQMGLFINCIEPPAVPVSKQLLRLSVSAVHTRQDLDRTAEILEQVGRIPLGDAI